MNKKTDLTIGIYGRYNAQLINENGDIEWDGGEADNMILDAWFDSFSGTSSLPFVTPTNFHLCIGTGAQTEPTPTDTDLNNQIKSLAKYQFSNKVVEWTSEHCISRKYATFDFEGFSKTENITELGIRLNSGTGTLVTRALIKTELGDLSSISVGIGQTLRITYSIYIYNKHIIANSTIAYNGGDLNYIISYLPSNYLQNPLLLDEASYPTFSPHTFWTEGITVGYEYTSNISYLGGTIPAKRKKISLLYADGITTEKWSLKSTYALEAEVTLIQYRSSYGDRQVGDLAASINPILHVVSNLDDSFPVVPANSLIEFNWEIKWGRLEAPPLP